MSNQNTSNNLLFVGSANSSNIAGNGKELSSTNQPNLVNNNQHASGIGTFKFKCFGFVMGLTLYKHYTMELLYTDVYIDLNDL